MTKSGGNDGFGGDEVSLLVEELIQLSVKSSMVEPNEKSTLICTTWTEKSYNPDSFKAQMKSIWKTKRKFEIQSVRQNLFMIVFELEEDLKTVMEEIRSDLFHPRSGSRLDRAYQNLTKKISCMPYGLLLEAFSDLKSMDEKLSKFCFGCGKLGHDLQECT
ncbi:hypothetical protein Godav_009646, partial [Gossypium davidsonii]|nr:hypothetical protein [Gossypium davidsonii]